MNINALTNQEICRIYRSHGDELVENLIERIEQLETLEYDWMERFKDNIETFSGVVTDIGSLQEAIERTEDVFRENDRYREFSKDLIEVVQENTTKLGISEDEAQRLDSEVSEDLETCVDLVAVYMKLPEGDDNAKNTI